MAANRTVDKRTDEEWFADWLVDHPVNSPAVYAYAINAALQDKASSHGIDVITIDASDVSSAAAKSKTGYPVGVGKDKFQTALWTKEHDPVTKTIKRGEKEVGSFTYIPVTATAHTFTHGGFSDGNNLDVASYLAEARSQVGESFGKKQSPEQAQARLAEQKAVAEANFKTRQALDAVADVGVDLTNTLKNYTTALLQAEHQGLVGLNELHDIKPHDLNYPQKKHRGQSDDFIDRAYKSALAMPKGYNLLNVGDPTLDPRVTSIPSNQRMDVALKTNEVLLEHLHTTVAHLKVVDFKTSLDDDPHPLIGEYEAKYGEIRELTTEEMNRVNLLEGKLPPVPDDEKKFDADGKEIKPEFKFDDKNIFVGGINVSDIGSPDPKITSGQVFFADAKRSPKNTNISGVVNVVGGDPTKPIDEIYIAEGAATAAAMQELLENEAKLNPEKYAGKNILVLSAYNANNFVESSKMLHHAHPTIPLNAISDNDIKVMLQSGSGRPLLDNDKEFIYIARNNSSTIAHKDLPTDQEEQRLALKVNAGADAAHELNNYFLDNPNKDADGNLMPPMAAAFIINKGKGGLNTFAMVQQSPNLDNATPLNERLLDPKVDLNDVIENTKNLLRHQLKHNDKQLAEQGKPKVSNEDKLNSLAQLEASVQRVLIDTPAETMRQKLQGEFFTRVDLNEYDKPKVEPVEEVANKSQSESTATYEATANTVTASQPTTNARIDRREAIIDNATQYESESKAATFANKYSAGFMIPETPPPAPANENKIDDPIQQQSNVQTNSPRP